MAKARCEICGRNFKNEEALEMHNRSKHAASEKKESKKSLPVSKGKIIVGIIVIAIIALIWWAVAAAVTSSDSCKTAPVTEMNIGGHANLALHIHPKLQIVIDGQPQIIPANIGIAPGIMRPIHTHDASGELHLEAQCVRDFKLGEFFQIWGRPFNENQIFDKTSAEGTITMTVNGVANNDFENYEMKDHDMIVITFTSL